MVVSDKLPPTGDERCGTSAGYRAHRTRAETPCDSCRQAQAVHERAYKEANRAAIAAQRRNYRAGNRQVRSDYASAYYEANRDSERGRSLAYYYANREVISERARGYREKGREATAVRKHAWYEANSEEIIRRSSARRAYVAQAFASLAAHTGQAWTPEDETIIRATYDQPIVMVAAQLRRTPRQVMRRRALLRKFDRNQRKVTS